MNSRESFQILAALAALATMGCTGGPHGLDELRARGVFRELLDRGARESELFRRSLLVTSDAIGRPAPSRAELLANAIARFQERAASIIEQRAGRGIDGFRLDREDLVNRIAGQERLDGERIYGPFAGRWYGRWTTLDVDHHWSELVVLEPPLQVALGEGGETVWIRSWQYAWVGDGYGLNLVATGDGARDVLLGYVVHVENGDLERERIRRPHVGIALEPGQLIWITKGEVFLEEVFRTEKGTPAYAITGFDYELRDGRIVARRAFQTIYTRNPKERPEWWEFQVEL